MMAEQLDALERLARELEPPRKKGGQGAHNDRSVSAKYRAPSPYPGLRPYLDDEARFFRGREAQIHEIGERLAREHAIAILGGSGSGKSSIIRAGVIPALRRKLIPGRSDLWRTAVCMPGRAPIDNLVEALDDTLRPPEAQPSLEQAHKERRDLIRRMLYREGGLGGFLPLFREQLKSDSSLSQQAREGANLLIVIDQFEELFREESRGKLQVATLVDLIVGHWRQRDSFPGLYLALTMRSDDLHRCAEFVELPEFINHTSYLTRRLNDQEVRNVIIGPVRPPMFRAGLLSSEGPRGGIDVRPYDVQVVKEVIDSVEEIGHDPDHLPLLQHLLAVTWRQAVARWKREAEAGALQGEPAITREDLASALRFDSWDGLEARRHQIGQKQSKRRNGWLLRECLERVADGLWEDNLFGEPLTPQQREIARISFCLMGEVDDRGNYKRRWTTRQDIAAIAGLSFADDNVERVIERFSLDHRLIWPRPGGDIDVSHESLMRNWPRLQDWLCADMKAREAYRELAEYQQRWQETNDDPYQVHWFWEAWLRNDHGLLGKQMLKKMEQALGPASSVFRRGERRYNTAWVRHWFASSGKDGQDSAGNTLDIDDLDAPYRYRRWSETRRVIVRKVSELAVLSIVLLTAYTWIQNEDLNVQNRTMEASALWVNLGRPKHILDTDYVNALWDVSQARMKVRTEFVAQLTSGDRLTDLSRQPGPVLRSVGLLWPAPARTLVSDLLLDKLAQTHESDEERTRWGSALACTSAALKPYLTPKCRERAATRAAEDLHLPSEGNPGLREKGRILACQTEALVGKPERAKAIKQIFDRWLDYDIDAKGNGWEISAMSSFLVSAAYGIREYDGRAFSDRELRAIDKAIATLTKYLKTERKPTQWSTERARLLVQLVTLLPQDQQRHTLSSLLTTIAQLPKPGRKNEWADDVMLSLVQAFEHASLALGDAPDALVPIIEQTKEILLAESPPESGDNDLNSAAVARAVMPLIQLASRSEIAATNTAVADFRSVLARACLANQPDPKYLLSFALWGRQLALLADEDRDAFGSEGPMAQALRALGPDPADAKDATSSNPIAPYVKEAIARSIAALATGDIDESMREQAIQTAREHLAGTGSAEEAAAWAEALDALTQSAEEDERVRILVDALSFPPSALGAREPNARFPENATDILIRALAETVDPSVLLPENGFEWRPGYFREVLTRLDLERRYVGVDLRGKPLDPRALKSN